MKSKMFLISIAIVGIGVYLLPSALAIFSGQHTFDKAGTTTICVKCHSDVLAEIQNGNYHQSLIAGSDCKGCHTTATVASNLIPKGNGGNASSGFNVGFNISSGNFTMANGTNATGYTAHAAITVECVSCHYAVNFTNDAHNPFYSNTSSNTWLRGANEACIGCHTKTVVQMTWTRKGGYNYTYDFQNSSGTLSFNGTNVSSSTNNVV